MQHAFLSTDSPYFYYVSIYIGNIITLSTGWDIWDSYPKRHRETSSLQITS